MKVFVTYMLPSVRKLQRAKEARPQAKLLVHPECRSEVVALADYVGSTAGIIKYAEASKNTEFLVATWIGVFAELKKRSRIRSFMQWEIRRSAQI